MILTANIFFNETSRRYLPEKSLNRAMPVIIVLPINKWEKWVINEKISTAIKTILAMENIFLDFSRIKIIRKVNGAKKSGINWLEYQPIPVNKTKNRRIP